MDQILHDLGQLLLNAVPTFLLVVLLYFYLKRVFFRPLEQVLEARRQATEGNRKLAEDTFAKASAQATQHEAAVRAARGEVYREQEEARRRWEQEHAAAIQEARGRAEEMIQASGRQLQSELAEAKRLVEMQAGRLAGQMAEKVLARRAV